LYIYIIDNVSTFINHYFLPMDYEDKVKNLLGT